MKKQIIANLSTPELILLIDQIQDPCLVLNEKNKNIICGNLQFIKATGLGNQELIHQVVNTLISCDDLFNMEEGQTANGFLTTRNRNKIPILITRTKIAIKDGVSLLTMVLEKNKILKGGFTNELNSLLITTFDISTKGDLDVMIHALVDSAGSLLGLENTALYLEQDTELIRKSKSNSFPEKLPIIESDRLQNMDFWYPGKRILCEIHRIGRKKGFPGVLSVPIKSKKSNYLFVAAVDEQEFYSKNEELIVVFFKWMQRFLGHTFEIRKFRNEFDWLKNQSNIFSNFIETANDLMIVVNNKNIIEFASDPFLKHMQYSAFEILNKNILDFIHEKEFEKALLDECDDFYKISSPVKMHDRSGKYYYMEILMSTVVQSECTYKVITFRNLTKEVRLAKSIDSMQKKAALGEVIADFAHEVRNPINNISTGLQMVRKLNSENEILVDAVDGMQADCIRMDELMESILSYSRQSYSDFRVINLSLAIENVYKRFANKFKKNEIIASISNKFGKTRIIGDIRALEQVFINLINNSIDAIGPEGGELAILIKSNSLNTSEIEVSIADTGGGIPKEILGNIFDPFVSGKKKGTGLGLAITKRIIEAHKGRVEIESFTSGTIFRLFFPIMQEED